MYVQADLDLRCPLMLEDMFSHGAAQNVLIAVRWK